LLRSGIFLLCCACLAAQAESLQTRIHRILAGSPALSGGFAGVRVVSLSTGKVLADHDGNRLFVPASNTKLFSTSLALMRLGAGHRFTTRVLATEEPRAGVLKGDLVLYGGGDPTMSNRPVPYDRGPAVADPMEAIDQLAAQIAGRGVRSVEGDVIGDDSAYVWEPYPPGWAEDDTVWDYGAPVSALSFNRNCVVLGIAPGLRDGDAAVISPQPSLEYFVYDNRLRTVSTGETDIEVERAPGSREVILRGTVRMGAEVSAQWIAVDDPALYSASSLYEALVRRGIVIRGHPVSRHRWPGDSAPSLPPMILAERQSPPLIEVLRVIDKISDNLWAEMAMREVARMRTGTGSRDAGLKELAQFLNEIGIAERDYSFSDASGLSRLTLVKPVAVVRLLAYMDRSPVRDLWRSLLPVGGFDGTLMNRFATKPEARNLQAKTGSLSHVNSLSGYATSARYGNLAFSIFVNHTTAPASEVRNVIDRIGLALVH
jgi:D-alanyl-D-alanine carboxypeptidase/D-alanyl-D-alanine-endopeptidase (penicillin-binding protein 4)